MNSVNFHLCKTEEEMENTLSEYFKNNLNVNNGSSMSTEIDKYVINENYENYLKEFLKK